MTNPNNAVGTNAAFSGRTSPNALNDGLAGFSKGVVSGWDCVPSSGLTVALGGSGTIRDVAIAEDNSGNKLTINNISGLPINVTIGAAPVSNSRIDVIVAYVDNPPQGSNTITDNYGACGLIVVAGTASSNPTAPNDTAIRSAITADGASGITAYYVVLAQITIASGTTDITNGEISSGDLSNVMIRNGAIGPSQLDFASLNFGNYSTSEVSTGFTWVDGKTIYKKTINFGSLPDSTVKTQAHGITNLSQVIKMETIIMNNNGAFHMVDGVYGAASTNEIYENAFLASDGNLTISTSTDRTSFYAYITLYYTKTNS